mmetsp:Transcript_10827/g.27120  ORF Transcript_10827/g.27120 Transcript_10827/m.27120 type:complete len:221 (+) Transcript_10827:195-857(+)
MRASAPTSRRPFSRSAATAPRTPRATRRPRTRCRSPSARARSGAAACKSRSASGRSAAAAPWCLRPTRVRCRLAPSSSMVYWASARGPCLRATTSTLWIGCRELASSSRPCSRCSCRIPTTRCPRSLLGRSSSTIWPPSFFGSTSPEIRATGRCWSTTCTLTEPRSRSARAATPPWTPARPSSRAHRRLSTNWPGGSTSWRTAPTSTPCRHSALRSQGEC